MIEFIVPAVPVAQPRQRHRIVGRGTNSHVQNYTPSTHPVQAFKASVRMAAREEYKAQPLEGPVSVHAVFVMPRPRSMCWKRKPMPRERHTKKPDEDNLKKAVYDALNKMLWRDDSQICESAFEKWIAAGDEQPHVVIRVTEVSPA